ncbi:PspA/IM30 family protein [Nocardia yamanashiensis]|uniref:PspA/IM30 family protein n=1 Tax=Nocardia yamanashiensis TaxID=209247 RepID=UPI000A066319|nr:hypothetical protein [Nocardia yamanashiensis]
MSHAEGLAAELGKLSDAELAAVVGAATDGRAGLAALHEVALSVAVTVGHAPHIDNVMPATPAPAESSRALLTDTFQQVGTGPVVDAELVPPAGIPVGPGAAGYANNGVPTFESVRDKVEQRYGTAQGMSELDSQTPVGRSVEEQWDAREKAARERLEQIRKSVHRNDKG